MPGTFLGAVPEQLDSLAGAFSTHAVALRGLAGRISWQLGATPWSGPDLDTFQARWHGELSGQIAGAAQSLEDAATRLRFESRQQRQASADSGFRPPAPIAIGPGGGAAGGPGTQPDGAGGDGGWTTAIAEFNDKYLGPPVGAAALAVAPAEGLALYRLLQNQGWLAQDTVELRTAFSEIVGPVAYRMDQGLASLTDLNDALIRFRNGADAVQTFQQAATTELVHGAGAGGLPETGAIGALGKVAGVLGVASDALVLINPGVPNHTEGQVLRVAAAANIVGTAMAFAPSMAALVGINAVADWIPGVGQVVMVATGLFLTGDYVYHHWDQISHFVTDSVPHALGDAADTVGHGLSEGAHAVGHFFSSLF